MIDWHGSEAVMNSKQRVMDFGEVYTPPHLVEAMLDLIPHECERIESRFLEPACGSGNFLVEVLRRKLLTVTSRHGKTQLTWERSAVLAISSLYGIDLLPDNITACRVRLRDLVVEACQAQFSAELSNPAQRSVLFILSRNIVQGDALTFRDAAGQPIVLSEWSPIGGDKLKRRDFRYSHLLEHAHTAQRGSLFSDLGHEVFLPEPIAEWPPCHYLQVADASERIS